MFYIEGGTEIISRTDRTDTQTHTQTHRSTYKGGAHLKSKDQFVKLDQYDLVIYLYLIIYSSK